MSLLSDKYPQFPHYLNPAGRHDSLDRIDPSFGPPPMQGDHVLGDLVDVVQSALQLIFGGGAAWRDRLATFHPSMHALWTRIDHMDCGHHNIQLSHARGPVVELDVHASTFGRYAQRFKAELCEIVSTNAVTGTDEVRQIGGYSVNWKQRVMSGFQVLLDHSVDKTALQRFIGAPGTIDNSHQATSLNFALQQCVSISNLNSNLVRNALTAIQRELRPALAEMIDCFDPAQRARNALSLPYFVIRWDYKKWQNGIPVGPKSWTSDVLGTPGPTPAPTPGTTPGVTPRITPSIEPFVIPPIRNGPAATGSGR